MVVEIPYAITYARFGNDRLRGFGVAWGQIPLLSIHMVTSSFLKY